jgi:hypothetical protein
LFCGGGGGGGRVGVGKVCHHQSHKTASRAKATPLKSGHNPKTQNKWVIIFLEKNKKGGVGKYGWQMPKWRITCREAVFLTPKCLASGHTSTLRPGQISLMVRVDAGRVLVVAAGRSDVLNPVHEIRGQKQWGPSPPAAGCCPTYSPAPKGRVRRPRLSR